MKFPGIGRARLASPLLAAGCAAWLAAACGSPPSEPATTASPQPAPAAPAYSQNPAVPPAYTGNDLPPLPGAGYPAARPPEVVRAVYEFAARHPEVLSYVPCFCGCERSAGHGDNYDCFIRGRDPNGRPQWDGHGAGWGICIDVARDAMQMHDAGTKIADIRAAIERKYSPNFPTMTPTPPAPK